MSLTVTIAFGVIAGLLVMAAAWLGMKVDRARISSDDSRANLTRRLKRR